MAPACLWTLTPVFLIPRRHGWSPQVTTRRQDHGLSNRQETLRVRVSPQHNPAPARGVGSAPCWCLVGFAPALAGALALPLSGHRTKPLFTRGPSAAERRSGGLVNPVKKTNSSWAAACRRHGAQRLDSFLGCIGTLG